MARYECDVCKHVYDEEKDGVGWDELPEDWKCPICNVGKESFKVIKEDLGGE